MNTPKIYKVLLVDDHAQFLQVLEKNFSARGFTPVTALNETTALRQLTLIEIPIVIIDIVLDNNNPDNIDGIDLAAKIRQQYPTTAIILITGDPKTVLNVIRKAMSRGVDGKTIADNFYGKWEDIDILTSIASETLNHYQKHEKPTNPPILHLLPLYAAIFVVCIIMLMTFAQIVNNSLQPPAVQAIQTIITTSIAAITAIWALRQQQK